MAAITSNGREKRLGRALVGSSITAAVSGIAAIVLAVIGFFHVNPALMISVAAIIIGAGMLSEAGTLATEYSEILSKTRRSNWNKVEFGSGFSLEILVGTAAIVLGILAILDMKPFLLIEITIIALGAGLLFTSGAKALLNSMHLETPDNRRKTERKAHATLAAATWIQLLVSLAAIALGILSLLGFVPFLLTHVAILIIGVAMLLSGVAVCKRMAGIQREQATGKNILIEEETV